MTEWPTFDAQAIEAIRRDLSAYKRSSGHGAPRMAELISEANPKRPFVNQRRVSRFIAGDVGAPEPLFLQWCETFLKSLPKPPDPVFRLAQGLLAFCQAAPAGDYAGRYRLTVLALPDKTPDPSSTAALIIVPDDGFWRVEMRLSQRGQIADGALIDTPGGGIMITKDRLTQITQLCSLIGDRKAMIANAVGLDQYGDTGQVCFRLDQKDE